MKINLLWQPEDKIALALSGGVDSVVLFHLLVNKYKDSYKELVVFHINHGLRVESEEEELFIRTLCDKYNVKYYIEKLKLKDKTRDSHISEEMYARELRYKAFREMGKKENITTILTAHHKNDNVENIIMRIITGRGLNSELAILEKSIIENMTVLRPLLTTLKRDIQKYAEDNKIKYYEDATNYNTEDYTRNYVRHKIIPNIEDFLDSSFDNIIKFSNNYRELNSNLKDNIKDYGEFLNLEILNNNEIKLDFNKFISLKTLEKEFILLDIIKKYFNVHDVSKSSITSVIANLSRVNGNASYDLKENLKIIKEYESINICKIQKKCYNDKIEITEDSLLNEFSCDFKENKILITNYNDNAEIGFNKSDLPIYITSKQDGDRIKRGNITKKLSRLFIDEKIPLRKRDFLPIIRDKDGIILGVLGLGKVINKTKYDYYIKLK
ncbi:tRNA lysidine(34) synthetase TilS [Gemelliphila palaticanis]|uniref:tRNA(Ile)-lysidine synthase n=1 Tax=Gemelliphila palaticanis TaxID=81950 RepID=A0ABX2SYC2_9BACL|nr:tRNA lysidine(34) synthetase TilS [Gemella palaticanis]MBF0715386.1 tRNA lysidine(34) synthetase TilS [Gemella palaticanis]NYS47316.1 tRNA lysidine(34) synthetase TilS [Gemella palaticanis]